MSDGYCRICEVMVMKLFLKKHKANAWMEKRDIKDFVSVLALVEMFCERHQVWKCDIKIKGEGVIVQNHKEVLSEKIAIKFSDTDFENFD